VRKGTDEDRGRGAARWWRRWPRWEWGAGLAIIASLIISSRWGSRTPMMLQDIAFVVLVFAALGLPGMAWTAFELLRRGGDLRGWRMGVSLFGCVALSVAFASPFVCAVSSLDWMHVGGYVCVYPSLTAVLVGAFAPGLVRFGLILGGLVLGGLAVLIPVGVL
jgi:hypothetical protein